MSSFPPSQSKEGGSSWKVRRGEERQCGISKAAVYQKMLAVSSSRVVMGWNRERSAIVRFLGFYSINFRRFNPSPDSFSNRPKQPRDVLSHCILLGKYLWVQCKKSSTA